MKTQEEIENEIVGLTERIMQADNIIKTNQRMIGDWRMRIDSLNWCLLTTGFAKPQIKTTSDQSACRKTNWDDLLVMDWETLNDYCDVNNLITDPDDFIGFQNCVERLRVAIAKEVIIEIPKK